MCSDNFGARGAILFAFGVLMYADMSIIHVGWVDTHVPLEEQAALSARLFAEFDCLPVFLPQDIADGYYAGFCKGTLWPLLHYSQVKNFDEEVWEVCIPFFSHRS